MRPAAAMTLCTGSRPFRPRVPVPLFLSLQPRSPFLWLVRITERRVLLWPSLPLVRPQPCWAGRSRWARTTTERSRQAGSENLPFYKRSVFVSGGFLSLSLTASAQDEPSQIFKLDLFGACGDCPISGHRFSCVRWSRVLSLEGVPFRGLFCWCFCVRNPCRSRSGFCWSVTSDFSSFNVFNLKFSGS